MTNLENSFSASELPIVSFDEALGYLEFDESTGDPTNVVSFTAECAGGVYKLACGTIVILDGDRSCVLNRPQA